MDNASYMAMQGRVELLCRLLLDTDAADLDAFIEAGEHSDAIAPFIDPTAWSRGHDALRRVITHAEALATARRAIAETLE